MQSTNRFACSLLTVVALSVAAARPASADPIFTLIFGTTAAAAAEAKKMIDEAKKAAEDKANKEALAKALIEKQIAQDKMKDSLKAESPCNNVEISPDSSGFFGFRFSSAVGGAIYDLQFSKNNTTWPHSVEESVAPGTVPVNVYGLLAQSQTWFWRVKVDSFLSPVCKFKIKANNATTLKAPKLVTPPCGSTVSSDVLNLDVDSNGGFKVYAVEVEAFSANAWAKSNLVSLIDKREAGYKYGFFIPVKELKSKKYRWRARIATEKMPPLLANTTQSAWTDWCEFKLPMQLAKAKP